MNVLEARKRLNLTQQQAAELSGFKPKAISLMELGKQPTDAAYAAWLGQQMMAKYKRIQDMPVAILASAIRNRKEV